MPTYTISWQPGALKGYNVAQTSALIINGCQMLMKCCGVRFATVPFGYRSNITLYPYRGSNPPWAMATYVQTGQVLYSTSVKFEANWAKMAFAHEFLHCFGWGHSNSSPENIMHTRGSSVLYPTAAEAARMIRQFGYPSSWQWPDSLRFVGDKIRAEQKIFDKAQSDYEKFHKRWQVCDAKWKTYRDARNKEKDPVKRKEFDKLCRSWLEQRTKAGNSRLAAVKRRTASNNRLTPLSKQWLRIRSEWSRLFGVKNVSNFYSSSEYEPKAETTCSCFGLEYPVEDDGKNYIVAPQKPLEEIFKEYKDVKTEPIPGLEIIT